jgi:hypothetical protein
MATTRQLARFLSAHSLGSALQCTLRWKVGNVILCNASASVTFDRLIYALVFILAPNCSTFLSIA